MLGWSRKERMIKAIKDYDEKTVLKLLDADFSVNEYYQEDGYSGTLLHWAVRESRFGIVQILLDKGADCANKDSDGKTPAEMAGPPEILRQVIQAKYKNDLFYSIQNRNMGALADLLKNNPGMDLANITRRSGITLLHDAAIHGPLEAVKMFIALGSNVNAQAENGNTALHLAASYQKDDVVEYLIERGADVRLENKSGYCAEAVAGHSSTKRILSRKLWEDTIETLLPPPPLGLPLPPEAPPALAASRSVEEIILVRPLADRVLMEVFNFKTQEYTRMIRTSENGPVENSDYAMFPDVRNRSRLREAFDEYKKRGGTGDEKILHTLRDDRIKRVLSDKVS